MNRACHGLWPPAATPFADDLAIDVEAFVHHCRTLLREGAHGLAILGTTSEANSLSLAERRHVLERLIAADIPPARLLPGTGACALGDAVELTRAAVASGCAGALLLPPFYYKGVSDEGLFAFVSALVERVGDARLRLYLYNFPQLAGAGWSVALVGRLVSAFPETVVGLKDSSGDRDYLFRLLAEYPGFAVFPASEAVLLEALRRGAAGCISATANVNAPGIRALIDGWRGPEAPGLQAKAAAVRNAFQAHPLIAAVKAALADRYGAPSWRRVRPPLDGLTEAGWQALRRDLAAGVESAPA